MYNFTLKKFVYLNLCYSCFFFFRFHAVATKCQTDITELHCGSKAAKFVYTLLTGLMPPFCDNSDPKYEPIGSDTTRTWNSDQDSYGISRAGTALVSSLTLLLCLYAIIFHARI